MVSEKILSEQFDVVIAGGGLVGLLTALALSKLKLKIALIERKDLSQQLKIAQHEAEETHLEKRTFAKRFAINWRSTEIFRDLGIFAEVMLNAPQISKITVGIAGGRLNYDSTRDSSMGYIIPESVLMLAILKRVISSDDIELISSASILPRVTQAKDHLQVLYHKNQDNKALISLKAKLLVIADGANSLLKDAVGIETKVHDCQQDAWVFDVIHSKNHYNRAYEFFSSNGPLALLPNPTLAGNYSSAVIWSIPNSTLEKGIARASYPQYLENLILELINEKFGDLYGNISLSSPMQRYPLVVKISKHFIAERAVAIGSSSFNIHPVAGQALNLAIRNIDALVRIIKSKQAPVIDCGASDILHALVRDRCLDNNLLSANTYFMGEVVGRSAYFPDIISKMGMNMLEKTHFLKKSIKDYASGRLYNKFLF